MFNQIKNTISQDNLEENNYFTIKLGKIINETAFKTSLDEDTFYKYLELIKVKRNKLEVRNEQHITFFDISMIADLTCKRRCFKNKIISQKIYNNGDFDLKLSLINKLPVSNDVVQPMMSYHSEKKISSFVFTNTYYEAHFKIITDTDKDIFFEIEFICLEIDLKKMLDVVDKVFSTKKNLELKSSTDEELVVV